MKSASARSAAWVVTRRRDAALSSASLTSPVGSRKLRYAATFLSERSKPMVGCLFPNSTARGRPTYPKPTTATTVTSTPFVEFARSAPDGDQSRSSRAGELQGALQCLQQRRSETAPYCPVAAWSLDRHSCPGRTLPPCQASCRSPVRAHQAPCGPP